MRWQTVPLGSIIMPANPVRLGHGRALPVLSMTTRDGLVEQASRFRKRIAGADLSEYKVVNRGQLVVGFPIDEAVLAFQWSHEAGIVSPAYGVWDIRDARGVDRKYLERYLRSSAAISFYRAKLRGTTLRRRTLPRGVFEAMPVPLPPLPEQRRIAAILDEADALRVRAGGVLSLQAELAEASFRRLEMSLSGVTVPLGEIAEVSSGITKGRRAPTEPLTSTPYMTVANVQDRRLDLGTVKTIDVSARERDRYRLVKGDLLLTEGGDPDKLGRGAVWDSELPISIHQNHVFRVRLQSSEHSPDWLNWEVGSAYGKKYFLRAAKQTTGIATINASQLRAFPVRLPTKPAVERFLTDLREVKRLSCEAARRVTQLDELFASLQHRAFRGKL